MSFSEDGSRVRARHAPVRRRQQSGADNIERLVEAGYRVLMPGAPRSFAVLNRARELTGRYRPFL